MFCKSPALYKILTMFTSTTFPSEIERLCVGIGFILLTSIAVAQQSEQKAVLEEIIVTATRVERNLQEVPISVTALTSETLKRLGVTRVKDLEMAVPGLAITGSDHNAFFPLAIRGIFSESRVNGFEMAYGVYVDGVFQGRPMTTNLDLVDVERIEVLRGPQGTNFGRNTIAGAINITTRRPDLDEATLYVEQTIGSFNLADTRLSASYPVIPGKLALKVSGVRTTEEGYITNLYDGNSGFGGFRPTNQDFNNEDNLNGRFELRYAPSDQLTIDLAADVLTEDRRVIFVEVGLARGERLAPGKFTVNYDGIPEGDRDIWGVTGTVNYDFANGHHLTSITAYREGESFFIDDDDSTPAFGIYAPFKDAMKQFTQEVRIMSPQDGKLRYVVGAFYLDQEALTEHDAIIGPELGAPGIENDFLVGVPGFPTGIIEIDESFGTVDTDSIALYVEAEYDFWDKFTLIGGIRWTDEDRKLVWEETGWPSLGIPPIGPFTSKVSDSDVSPLAGIRYAITDDLNTYFRWSQGFRSGGFNNDLFIPTTEIDFTSETVDAFEIGLKAQFWDDRVRLNVAGFFMKYKDLQQPTFDDKHKPTPVIRVTNAGAAEITGVEVDYIALILPELTVSGGLSYTNAEFTDFVNVITPGDSFNGFRLPKVPEWTANASVQYQTALQAFNGTFVARLDWHYRGDLFSETRNDPRELVPGRSVFNGRIGVTVGEQWEVFFWGKNILDEPYLNEQRFVDGFNQQWVNRGKPRSYGLTASYRY